jgi:hypothetical protein
MEARSKITTQKGSAIIPEKSNMKLNGLRTEQIVETFFSSSLYAYPLSSKKRHYMSMNPVVASPSALMTQTKSISKRTGISPTPWS